MSGAEGGVPRATRVETPDQVDVVGVLDGGDAVEGVGVSGLHRPRRLRRLELWFVGEGGSAN